MKYVIASDTIAAACFLQTFFTGQPDVFLKLNNPGQKWLDFAAVNYFQKGFGKPIE